MDIAASVSIRSVRGGNWRAAYLAAGLLATTTATAISVLVALGGTAEHPARAAVTRALIVAVPAVAGLCRWYRRDQARFGAALAATSVLLFVTTLAESRDSTLYTIGRTAGWLMEIVLVYLVLAYPSGRLAARVDRLLVAAITGVVVVAFMPRLVLAQHFPVPNPFTSCAHACPANALFTLDHEPSGLVSVLTIVGAVGAVAMMSAVVVRLWGRIAGATPLARRMLGPVLVIAIARTALFVAGMSIRDVDGANPGLELVSWLMALLIPALALAFLAGLVRWRMFAGQAMLRLAECLPAGDPAAVQRAFANAFRDPTVQIAFRTGEPGDERWCDAFGHELTVPQAGSGRTLTTINDGDRPVAALLHDEALTLEPEVLRAGTAIAGTALVSRRLATEADAAMREVRRSRARIASAAERERRRIERDLHDGAQQQLVALRIELGLAEELVRQDPARAARRIHELEERVDDAIDELRALAHGIYPPILADRGVTEALRVVAAGMPVAVSVTAHDVGRYPEVIESTIYFCVNEALQNVLKHADGVQQVRVTLDGGGDQLDFAVSDDGAGMEEGYAPGRGLANMRERMATVGGAVSISSTPRAGTVVRGRIPLGASLA
ncbi:MAG: histidine kinase [Solirubrobacterales bacterium]